MNPAAPQPSNLFYQGRQRRPMIKEARGIYIFDVDGNRYIDGSSGAMVANIGHGTNASSRPCARRWRRRPSPIACISRTSQQRNSPG